MRKWIAFNVSSKLICSFFAKVIISGQGLAISSAEPPRRRKFPDKS
ncbi:hypothetical protein [Clostridium gasigenes]|nr:hypothetical protein [Clostridium gasigenes]